MLYFGLSLFFRGLMIVFWQFFRVGQVFSSRNQPVRLQSILDSVGKRNNNQWLRDQNRNGRCQLFWNNLLSKPAHTIAHKQQLKIKCFSMIWRGKSGRKVSFYLVFRQYAVGSGDGNGKGTSHALHTLHSNVVQSVILTIKVIPKPFQYLLKLTGEDNTSNLQ